ncbi:MAG TPA: beta-ketoacyl synthase N-terminal-like domain-containing protein [Methylomirabilota bacterium]|nr:beta-ketoacyl synthase N-terminal-like domain-containing protein [Methylomirabilota bacterium]
MSRSVVVTGIGIVNAAVVGASPALGAWLARPRAAPRTGERPAVRLPEATLAGLMDPDEARRLSRVCRLTVAAARLAVAESGIDPARGLGLVVGSELGDFASTIAFADGYLARGPAGLSPLLFPNTVMNTMAAATAIAVAARELALTINVPTVAGELAVARGAAAVASGRTEAVVAGGVDELDPLVAEMLGALGDGGLRGEGATFLVLETEAGARTRGAPVLGRIAGVAWRALPAGPWGVGRHNTSRAIGDAVRRAGGAAPEWLYVSASGDASRDAWESRVLTEALGPDRTPAVSLAALVGRHAGLGALHVAAAVWTSRSGLLPARDGGEPARVAGGGLVHGLARGGGHVAIVVRPDGHVR